jgi:hypothetical protein
MADPAAPTAPPLKAAAAPVARPESPAKDAKPETKYKFELTEGAKFSLDNLLVQGSLEATLKLQDRVTATYRTLSVEEIQKVENAVPVGDQRDKSMKFVMNEMTIGQLYHSLIAMNGKALPAPGDGTEKDTKKHIVRNLPGVLFDLLVQGYNEFDRRSKELVTGENLRNF